MGGNGFELLRINNCKCYYFIYWNLENFT